MGYSFRMAHTTSPAQERHTLQLGWEATGQGRILNPSGMSAVLNASACLVYLQREAGAEVVAEILTHGAYISAVNLAEVLSKLAEWGRDPEQAYLEMTKSGLARGMWDA